MFSIAQNEYNISNNIVKLSQRLIMFIKEYTLVLLKILLNMYFVNIL